MARGARTAQFAPRLFRRRATRTRSHSVPSPCASSARVPPRCSLASACPRPAICCCCCCWVVRPESSAPTVGKPKAQHPAHRGRKGHTRGPRRRTRGGGRWRCAAVVCALRVASLSAVSVGSAADGIRSEAGVRTPGRMLNGILHARMCRSDPPSLSICLPVFRLRFLIVAVVVGAVLSSLVRRTL
jgi:hypothetical protein